MKLRNSNKFKKEFGARSFSSRKLPLYSDVGKHYLNILNRCKKSAISDTMDSLIEIWVSASLPVCGKNSIFRKLQRYINHIIYYLNLSIKYYSLKNVEFILLNSIYYSTFRHANAMY